MDTGYMSALHVAAQHGLTPTAAYLINTGKFDANETDDPYKWTALHYACSYQREEIVRLLLQQPNIDVNAEDCGGATAIAHAAFKDNTCIVELILDHPTIDFYKVYTSVIPGVLFNSCNKHNSEMLQLLLTKYETKFSSSGLLTEEVLVKMFAVTCRNGYVNTAKALMNYGHFDVNCHHVCRELGSTALQMACHNGQTNIVKLLLSNPNTDLTKENINFSDKLPPEGVLLFLSAYEGQNDVLELLMNNSALNEIYNKDEAMSYLFTATLQAICAGYLRTVLVLLDKVRYHVFKNPKKYGNFLIELLKSAIKSNMKSAAVYIHKMCMDTIQTYVSTHRTDSQRCNQLVYDYIEHCYTDDVISGPNASLMTEFIMHGSSKLYRARCIKKVGSVILILFHAIKIGLADHVEIALHQTPSVIGELTTTLPGMRMSLLQYSMKSPELAKRLLDIFKKDGEKLDPFERRLLDKFKLWYKILSKLSSSLNPSSNKSIAEKSCRERVNWILSAVERWDDHAECQMVRICVKKFMEKLSSVLLGTMFEFVPVLVGSANEGTRPFIPNEFDYLLVFKKLASYFDFTANRIYHLYRLRCKDKYRTNTDLHDLTNDGIFNADALKGKLKKAFQDAMSNIFTPTFCEYLTIEPSFYESDRKSIHNIRVVWRGKLFKDMPISIDLVPAFEFPGYQPYFFVGKLATGPYYLFTKEGKLLHHETLPVAFSIAEGRIVKSLPHEMRLGFKFAKALRRSMLFPGTIVKKLAKYVHSIEDYLTTYMLKTAVFFLAHSHGLLASSPSNVTCVAPLVWAKRIYECLLVFLYKGKVPQFFKTILTPSVAATTSLQASQYHAVFVCTDPLDIAENEMRSCCIRRRNLIIIADHMLSVIRSYMFGEGAKATETMLSCI